MRICDEGLRYEADPRHAEMLIKSFNLNDGKSVVTPGIKSDATDVDPDKIDTEASEEIRRIIADLKSKPRPATKVKFNDSIEAHLIEAYSEVYGRHPK